jgi:TMEM175 potassium channel family protein
MRADRGLDRLITFLDAVVAIAITLLVLPLVELVAQEGRETELGALFSHHGSLFVAFLLSFAVIARLWWAHRRLGEQVGAYDWAFVLINLVWVLTIVFLAFATQVVATYAGQLAVALYIGTITASSACLLLLTVLLRRRPGLRREDVETQDINLPAALSTTTLLVLALVLGVAVPAVNYWALLLLLLSGPTERLIRLPANRPSS